MKKYFTEFYLDKEVLHLWKVVYSLIKGCAKWVRSLNYEFISIFVFKILQKILIIESQKFFVIKCCVG